MMKKIIYTDRCVFGGFKCGRKRLFFVIPCLRISFMPFEGSFSLVFGLGILFWEFVWTIEMKSNMKQIWQDFKERLPLVVLTAIFMVCAILINM